MKKIEKLTKNNLLFYLHCEQQHQNKTKRRNRNRKWENVFRISFGFLFLLPIHLSIQKIKVKANYTGRVVDVASEEELGAGDTPRQQARPRTALGRALGTSWRFRHARLPPHQIRRRLRRHLHQIWPPRVPSHRSPTVEGRAACDAPWVVAGTDGEASAGVGFSKRDERECVYRANKRTYTLWVNTLQWQTKGLKKRDNYILVLSGYTKLWLLPRVLKNIKMEHLVWAKL